MNSFELFFNLADLFLSAISLGISIAAMMYNF